MESDLGQEAQRQRCPSPKSFLSLIPSLLLSQRKLERKCWPSPPSPLLNLCLPRGFFLSLSSHSLSFPFSPSNLFFKKIPPPYSIFPPTTPLSPPLLMPNTTKSAACGLNGNQTLTHSSLVCRLLSCTLNYLQLSFILAEKMKRKDTASLVLLFTGRVEMGRLCNVLQHLFFTLNVNKSLSLLYLIPALAPVIYQYVSSGIVF